MRARDGNEVRGDKPLNNRFRQWAIAIVALGLFSITNLPWQLDDYDQAKQAFTSFEMVKEGHWFFQRTPHDRVATKPPLVGWISAGLYEISRSWDLAWRLPSLAAAGALMVLLFRAGSAAGFAGGIVASSAFAFNLLTPRLATLVRTDMPLALVITAIGLMIWQKLANNQSFNSRDRTLLCALLTAAMLIKGPIIHAFLIPGLLWLQWLLGGQPKLRLGWWPWLVSLSVFLIWVVAGSVSVAGFYDQVVMREFLGRFGETVHRPQPFFFYVPHLLHKFSPWSVALATVAIVDLRRRSWNIRAAFRDMSRPTLWLVGWLFGGLIVMSIIPSKRVDRIFPLIPPMSLLLAVQFGRLFGEGPKWRWRRWVEATLVMAVLFAGGYSVWKMITGYRDHRAALVDFGRAVRIQAAAHHWKFEVIKTSDEGMLLYLDKTSFIQPEQAITEWNDAELDALVVPTQTAFGLMRDLHGSTVSALQSDPRKSDAGKYVLITR